MSTHRLPPKVRPRPRPRSASLVLASHPTHARCASSRCTRHGSPAKDVPLFDIFGGSSRRGSASARARASGGRLWVACHVSVHLRPSACAQGTPRARACEPSRTRILDPAARFHALPRPAARARVRTATYARGVGRDQTRPLRPEASTQHPYHGAAHALPWPVTEWRFCQYNTNVRARVSVPLGTVWNNDNTHSLHATGNHGEER